MHRGQIDFVRRQLEQFGRDGAQVFRIRIDTALTQGRIKNRGVAEPLQMARRHTGLARSQREDFADDVRLGESLGADLQRFGRMRDRTRQDRPDGNRQRGKPRKQGKISDETVGHSGF
jgi:hypothetical protein